ncbi:MAG: phosphoadenylyl-sulfate reductase [Lacibacter sp.]|jgi:phosphoadenosine phosphosulfate reductase
MIASALLTSVQQLINGLEAPEILKTLSKAYPGQVVFSTSFGMEDQVLTHMIATEKLDIDLFTLDTGRLFPETYSTWRQTIETYGISIRALYPDAQTLGAFVSEKGPNAFYESVENRKQCCHIRKVEPLREALAGYSIWITGLRASQSAQRSSLLHVEWDDGHRVLKVHPLLHWSWEEINDYIRKQHVPYNALHDKGYVSIGCAPCTRAIRPDEDFRAGRWWWEKNTSKECGLHASST